MRIAIPTKDGMLCPHFGHCRQFAIVDVDTEKREILKVEMLTPPEHEPGIIPEWLKGLGCNMVIAGGMGARAIDALADSGVGVVCGAPEHAPHDIVMDYLQGQLMTQGYTCGDRPRRSSRTGCRQREGNI